MRNALDLFVRTEKKSIKLNDNESKSLEIY